MTPIPDAAAKFAAIPLPLLFLDTCTLLDVVRAPARTGGLDTVMSARELLAHARPPGHRVYLVVMDVIEKEWKGNIDRVRKEGEGAELLFDTVNQLIPRLGFLPAFLPATLPPGTILPSGLVRHLEQLSSDLLSTATSLERDSECMSRAIDRQLPPIRLPARAKGTGAKDSVILEHALELSRRLGAGYAMPRYFVSSNTDDFAEGPSLGLKPVLVSEFASASLLYSPSLSDVVAQLKTANHI